MNTNALFAVTICLVGGFSSNAISQSQTNGKLEYVGKYEGLVARSSIHKMIDQKERVVCYIMQPDNVVYNYGNGGSTQYEGNNVGAISCVHIPESVDSKGANNEKKR